MNLDSFRGGSSGPGSTVGPGDLKPSPRKDSGSDHPGDDGHGHDGDDHDDHHDDGHHDHDDFDFEDHLLHGFLYGHFGHFGHYPYYSHHSLFYGSHHYFSDYPWYYYWFGYYPIYHSYAYPNYVHYQPVVDPERGDEVIYIPVYADAETTPLPAEEPYIAPELAQELEQLQSEQAAVESLKTGAASFKNGDYDAAAEAFRQALLGAPRNAVPKFAMAHALFAKGDYAFATFLLRRGMELLPEWPSVGAALHELYGNPDDLLEQTIALRTYLDQQESDTDARFLLAYVLFFSGNLDGAEQQFQRVADLAPDHIQTQAFLTRIAEIRAELEQSQEVPEPQDSEQTGDDE